MFLKTCDNVEDLSLNFTVVDNGKYDFISYINYFWDFDEPIVTELIPNGKVILKI